MRAFVCAVATLAALAAAVPLNGGIHTALPDGTPEDRFNYRIFAYLTAGDAGTSQGTGRITVLGVVVRALVEGGGGGGGGRRAQWGWEGGGVGGEWGTRGSPEEQ